jgi:hypothetical protein
MHYKMHYKDTKLHFMRNLPYLLLELLPVGHGNTHVYLRTILVAVEGALVEYTMFHPSSVFNQTD